MSNGHCFACRSFIQKIVKAFLYIDWLVPCFPPPPFFFLLIQLESFPVLPVTYAHSWTLEAQPWAQAASGSTQVCILLFVQSIFLGVSGTGILGYPSLKMLSPLKKNQTPNSSLPNSVFLAHCLSSEVGERESKKKRKEDQFSFWQLSSHRRTFHIFTWKEFLANQSKESKWQT